LGDKLVSFKETYLKNLIRKSNQVKHNGRQIQRDKNRTLKRSETYDRNSNPQAKTDKKNSVLNCSFCKRPGHITDYLYDKKMAAGSFLNNTKKVDSMAVKRKDADYDDSFKDACDEKTGSHNNYLAKCISEQLAALYLESQQTESDL
jgi:hypothetical protein